MRFSTRRHVVVIVSMAVVVCGDLSSWFINFFYPLFFLSMTLTYFFTDETLMSEFHSMKKKKEKKRGQTRNWPRS